MTTESEPDSIVHKDKDLRIDASPNEVAHALLGGGARPRPGHEA